MTAALCSSSHRKQNVECCEEELLCSYMESMCSPLPWYR